jgi:hypothetical protein
MVIRLHRNLGMKIDVMPDGRGKRYAFIVLWYPRRHQLGYRYGSIRLAW